MSVKAPKQEKKKDNSKFLKLGVLGLFVIILEAGAVFSAVKISESRNLKQIEQIKRNNNILDNQNHRLDVLEKLPLIISENAKKINALSSSLSLFSDSLIAMQQTVNKETLDNLNNSILDMSKKIEFIEETKNIEALTLSVALIIKENALYNRSFANEADILVDLSKDQNNIQNEISVIANMKNDVIENDISLINRFNVLSQEIVFEEPSVEGTENKETNAVTKSIKMIKDTVAGINFDKVVILKKDKKTNEQKALLSELKDLVNSHNFTAALSLIRDNNQFNYVKNDAFVKWQEDVMKNIAFNNAISHIIASELSAIRASFNNN